MNSIELHVLRSGSADDPLLILLHGFPEFWFGWRKQIGPLTSAGYHVVVPDQRGYNLSDKPKRIAAYDIDELAKDVVGLIDAMHREKAILVGHDWGAAVAWYAANQFSERIERLAILSVPHPVVMRRYLKHNLAQMRRSWYMFFFQIPWLPEKLMRLGNWWMVGRSLKTSSRSGTFSDSDLDLYRKAWSQPGAMRSMIHWYRALFRTKSRLPDPRIRVPTLMIWGGRDRFLGREMAQPSIELCDNGRLVFIENATHWVHHEEPDQVNRLILDFLKT